VADAKDGKFVPKRPNLAGDDVAFVRFDAKTGVVTGTGHMHRDHIKAEKDAGGSIVETHWQGLEIGKHVIDPDSGAVVGGVEPVTDPGDDWAHMLSEIRRRLTATDKFFTTDALDNIDQATQNRYREYRKKLRDVAKLTDPKAMQAAMPDDPLPDSPRISGSKQP
jgi:hypothetical protein